MNAVEHEIPFSRPEFDEAEARAVAEVLASGWVAQGPKVAQFEELFAERVGARHAVATTSCTTALHLALVVAGIGPGDEVICPSYSFIATANAILYAGATPVFADIEPDTWNIDPRDVEKRVTPRTKAILPVHQVGSGCGSRRAETLCRPGIHDYRGRSLRDRFDPSRPPRRRFRQHRLLQFSPAKDDFDR